jgi:hypothetical protein
MTHEHEHEHAPIPMTDPIALRCNRFETLVHARAQAASDLNRALAEVLNWQYRAACCTQVRARSRCLEYAALIEQDDVATAQEQLVMFSARIDAVLTEEDEGE